MASLGADLLALFKYGIASAYRPRFNNSNPSLRAFKTNLGSGDPDEQPSADNTNTSATIGMNRRSRFMAPPQWSNPDMTEIIFQSPRLSSVLTKKKPTAHSKVCPGIPPASLDDAGGIIQQC